MVYVINTGAYGMPHTQYLAMSERQLIKLGLLTVYASLLFSVTGVLKLSQSGPYN